jgi:CRP/FNR family transcriptional regulator
MPTTVLEPVHSTARALSTGTGGRFAPDLLRNAFCSACHLSGLCPRCCRATSETDGRPGVAVARRKVMAGQELHAQGDRFDGIYVVRCGVLKSTVKLSAHRGRICGFHMAGDVFGLDGAADGTHATTTTALEDSHVCAIAYAPLIDLTGRDPFLQRRLNRLMSEEISRGNRMLILLGTSSAQERLAAFLLDLSRRFDALGYSARDFNLRMARSDIASFLGLTLETVCRTFALFQRQGLLQINHRRIQFTDLESFSSRFKSGVADAMRTVDEAPDKSPFYARYRTDSRAGLA